MLGEDQDLSQAFHRDRSTQRQIRGAGRDLPEEQTYQKRIVY